MNFFGVGTTEILVILIVVLVLFGPDKLPELAKRIGGASREIRDNLDSLNDQMNSALETSMELDKARMTPPSETIPVEATAPAEPENKILREDSPAEISPPLSNSTASPSTLSNPAAEKESSAHN
ncbi:MAG: hypothetical protein EYC68_15290 [Chloroflexota bacterium]|nr:MAG: hypothetical protein EYC68_15290 [Chloroflexota bacterium]